MCQAAAVVALAAADMGVQELTTCLWSLSRLKYRAPEPWLEALAARGVVLLPDAWKQQLAAQQQAGDSADGSSVLPAARWANSLASAVSAGTAAQQLREQQAADVQEAGTRYRRRQLLQSMQGSQRQQQKLKREQWALQEQLLHPKQQQQQVSAQGQLQQWQDNEAALQWQRARQQSLLQLRGDLNHLQQQQTPPVAPYGAQPGSEQQQQQQQAWLAVSAPAHSQRRRLVAADLSVVCAAFAALDFQLPE
jgi:hypothetical protein